MSRYALYVLPASAVLVVALAVLVGAVPRPVVAARLYGGATEGVTELTFRLAVLRQGPRAEAPREVHVRAELEDGRTASWRGAIDDEGRASVRLEPGGGPIRGPVRVRVDGSAAGDPLAEGTVALSAEDWMRGARRRGGWLHGAATGPLRVRAAAGEGTFAVPFEGPLLVDVRGDAGPVIGARVRVRVEGGIPATAGAITDAAGRAVVRLAPLEHAAAVTVDATGADGDIGQLQAVLPVVPGALRARIEGTVLRVESPIERSSAYVSLVTESARLGGGVVSLAPDGEGGASGALSLDRGLDLDTLAAAWAVVSSEPDQRSMALIGWPLRWEAHGEPPLTLDVADALLLDGLPAAERRERRRQDRIRLGAAAFALIAMGASLVLVRRRVHEARERLAAHLRDAAPPGEAAPTLEEPPRSGVAIAVAMVCIALGFALIAFLATLRL